MHNLIRKKEKEKMSGMRKGMRHTNIRNYLVQFNGAFHDNNQVTKSKSWFLHEMNRWSLTRWMLSSNHLDFSLYSLISFHFSLYSSISFHLPKNQQLQISIPLTCSNKCMKMKVGSHQTTVVVQTNCLLVNEFVINAQTNSCPWLQRKCLWM